MTFVNKVIGSILALTSLSVGVVYALDSEDFPPCSLEISCPCTPDEVKPILEVGDKILFKLPGTNTVSNSIEIQ